MNKIALSYENNQYFKPNNNLINKLMRMINTDDGDCHNVMLRIKMMLMTSLLHC